MKILPAELIREADAFTIISEPIADIDLMERAAGACVRWMLQNIPAGTRLIVFCGPGNNGGDGWAIARMMTKEGYPVTVYNLARAEKMSSSCRINYERVLKECPGCTVIPVNEAGTIDLHIFSENDPHVVVDAIFGSGLTRPPEGIAAQVIERINHQGALVIAIDIPSGLFCDSTVSGSGVPMVVRADYTLTFSPPKLAFFFPENDRYAGKWQLLEIGISADFINQASVTNYMLEASDIRKILKKRNKFDHKGRFGHALIIAGSAGKMGAAVLATRACTRSGAGLVTVRIPAAGVQILQTAVPEAMLAIGQDQDLFTDIPDLTAYNAIAAGPGIGTSSLTATALKLLIQQAAVPLLLDADGLNILSENKTWLSFIPRGSVLTPHPREFERLAGKSGDDFARNRLQRELSFRYQCYIVLKGAHTAITTPDGACFFNTTGNPGMATGGSGDVLTGIIAGLMAQGYSALEAVLAGVYIHGLAGDLALQTQGYEALIAPDIIDHLGKAFQQLYG